MYIHVSVFYGVVIQNRVEVQTLIAGSHSDGWSEPLSEIGIKAWSDLDVITLVQEDIDAATGSDEPVVAEPVCFIRPADYFSIFVSVAVLLCISICWCCHQYGSQSRSSAN